MTEPRKPDWEIGTPENGISYWRLNESPRWRAFLVRVLKRLRRPGQQ